MEIVTQKQFHTFLKYGVLLESAKKLDHGIFLVHEKDSIVKWILKGEDFDPVLTPCIKSDKL